jgi:predicted MPP superfamily phosphohydrolase
MAVSRRAVLKTVLGAGVGALGGAAAHGYAYGRRALETTRATIRVDRLPDGLRGLRIGFITDLHCSRWVSPDDIKAAADRLMAERPDLIALGGDYVTYGDRGYVGPVAEALSMLVAPQGVFAVLGNHDDDHDMAAALGENGIQVLKDVRTRLMINREPLELTGIRYWTRKTSEIEPLVRRARGTVVLLAHDPRRLDEASELKIPIVLSGHTHGGQIVLPGLGAVAARKFPIVSGSGRRDTTSIFVSRGVGTVYVPVRVNCPPEVAILTLDRSAPRLPSP